MNDSLEMFAGLAMQAFISSATPEQREQMLDGTLGFKRISEASWSAAQRMIIAKAQQNAVQYQEAALSAWMAPAALQR